MKKTTTCIACKENKIEFLFETKDRMFEIPGNFTAMRCKNCGLVFVDPIPVKEVLARHYPSNKYYSYQDEDSTSIFHILRSYLVNHYHNPTFLSRLFSFLVSNVPAMPTQKKGKILDVGCGTGDTLILLKKLGWDVFGLEIDKNAITVAKKRGLKNVSLGSFEEINTYEDNYFDVIRLYHVIEHVDDPELCIKLIYRKLKPGGEIILGTPNVDSITSFVFRKFWYNLDIPRHLFLFYPTTLRNLIKKENFLNPSIEFCSAGGLVGSIAYTLSALLGRKVAPEDFQWLFFLLYPLEWFIDKLKLGDIMILKAIKR